MRLKIERPNVPHRAVADDGGGHAASRRPTRPAVPRGGASAPTSATGSGARCARTTAPDGDAWDLPSPRPRPIPRLSLGRGRHRRLRRRPARRSASGWRFVERPRTPILKERLYGLTNSRGQPRRGRQGAATTTSTPRRRIPTMRMLYKYPQAAFPYEDLIAPPTPGARSTEREYEVTDTGRVRRRIAIST